LVSLSNGNGPSLTANGLALRARIGKWSLTSLLQRLVKTGGRLIQHARYYWLLLAEGYLTQRLFDGMVRKIAGLLWGQDKASAKQSRFR
jgi:hypothetical protein